MSGRLLLVRHSLPEIQKDLPANQWRLSPEGRLRAHRLAERLGAYPFDLLASSLEPKAMETAHILSAKFGAAFLAVEGLHEHVRNTVPYLSRAEFETAVHEFFRKPDQLVFGSETADQAHERFSRAVYALLDGPGDKVAMIVAHGTVISLFVSYLTGRPGFPIWKELGMPGYVELDLPSKTLVALENIP